MKGLIGLLLLAPWGAGHAAEETAPLSKDAIVACADAGVGECQYQLATMVEEGNSFAKDLHTAKALYELAYRGGYEKAGPAVLRLTKHAAASASPAQGTANTGAILTSASMAPAAAFPNPSIERSAAAAGEVRFGAVFIGQTEAQFREVSLKSDCVDDVDQGLPIRKCEGGVRRSGNIFEVEAEFHRDRLLLLTVALADPSACDFVVKDVTGVMGVPTARWRSGFFSTMTGTLTKAWGDRAKVQAFLFCNPPKAGGLAIIMDSGEYTKAMKTVDWRARD